MSSFLANNSGAGCFDQALRATDDRVQHKHWRWQSLAADLVQIQVWQPGVWWSGSGFCGAGGAGTFGMASDDMNGYHSTWDVQLEYTGGGQALKLKGTTRDSTGAVLGNCIVEGFVTATDASIGKVTSDSAGYFELPSSAGAVAHYIVAYKAAGPDIAGTTVNTLVPA